MRDNKILVKVDWTVFLCFLFMVVAFIAYLIGYGALDMKDNNDLLTYSSFYNCLVFSGAPSCLEKVGSSFEYFFYLFSYVLSLVSPDYNFFIFLYSFVLNSLLLIITMLIVRSLGLPIAILSVIYLLSDVRFYELSGNVLRHGLATTLMLVFVYSIIHFKTKRGKKILALFPVLSHVSSFGYLIVFIKSRLLDNRIFWLFIFAISFLLSKSVFEVLIQNNTDSYIVNKLNYYVLNNSEPGRIFPYHVLIVILASFILNIVDFRYLVVKRVMYSYVTLALIFFHLGMSYRYISFMYPLCAICFAYQMSFISNAIARKEVVLILYLLTVCVLCLMFLRNYERISAFFSIAL